MRPRPTALIRLGSRWTAIDPAPLPAPAYAVASLPGYEKAGAASPLGPESWDWVALPSMLFFGGMPRDGDVDDEAAHRAVRGAAPSYAAAVAQASVAFPGARYVPGLVEIVGARRDPLATLLRALDERGAPPLWWVIAYSHEASAAPPSDDDATTTTDTDVTGPVACDALARAWRESQNAEALARVVWGSGAAAVGYGLIDALVRAGCTVAFDAPFVDGAGPVSGRGARAGSSLMRTRITIRSDRGIQCDQAVCDLVRSLAPRPPPLAELIAAFARDPDERVARAMARVVPHGYDCGPGALDHAVAALIVELRAHPACDGTLRAAMAAAEDRAQRAGPLVLARGEGGDDPAASAALDALADAVAALLAHPLLRRIGAEHGVAADHEHGSCVGWAP